MRDVVSSLRQAGMSELACQFAAFIERLDNTHNSLVALSAGLLSETVSQGHVCLNLNSGNAVPAELVEQLPADATTWQQSLLQSNVVGQPGEFRPLILTEQCQLYLYRYWQDELDVAAAFKSRSQMVMPYDQQKLVEFFAQWQSDIEGIDWQKVAVLSALTQGLTIISGGPGTGKTTIVKTILRLFNEQDTDLRIALAAPTGKAAARLQQAVQSEDCSTQAKTLHRLLGITPDKEQGRYSAQNPLPVDVLIVDEASMIDVSLMAKLLAALPEKARLILLGDSQQLASVESGAVFANLCEQAVGFSKSFITLAGQCGLSGLPVAESARLFVNQLIQLQHSYRFDADSLIGRIARQINVGNADAVLELVMAQTPSLCQPATESQLLAELKNGYHAFIDAVNHRHEPQQIIAAFDSFRILAALKQGPQSVDAVNHLMHRYLAQIGWQTQQDFYLGRPIMITKNDDRQHLYNGDVGVVLKDETGQLKACFCFDDTPYWVPLNRLPAHETAFAMTVHKSQGSEFDRVSILLPDVLSPILTRELLYTAITRARQSIFLLAAHASLKQSITTRHERESGLKTHLQTASVDS